MSMGDGKCLRAPRNGHHDAAEGLLAAGQWRAGREGWHAIPRRAAMAWRDNPVLPRHLGVLRRDRPDGGRWMPRAFRLSTVSSSSRSERPSRSTRASSSTSPPGLGAHRPAGDYDWNSGAARRTNARPLNVYPARVRA